MKVTAVGTVELYIDFTFDAPDKASLDELSEQSEEELHKIVKRLKLDGNAEVHSIEEYDCVQFQSVKE